jgi:uncharacterized membrane protein YbhN (UPF0104 family)
LISLLVVAGLTVWAGYYLSANFGQFRETLAWNPATLGLLSGLVLIQFVLLGLFNRVILKGFDLVLSFKEWFGLSIITTLGNYLLPPRGGAGLRAAYLKKRRGFPLTHFMSTFVAFYVLHLAAAGLFGLLALAALPDLGREVTAPLLIFLGAVTLFSAIVVLFPVRAAWFDRPGLRLAARLIEGWQTIKGRRSMVGLLLILVLANYLVQGAMILAAYRSLGLDLGAAGAVLVTSLLSLTSLIALTPGGLGIQEAVLVFSTGALGILPAQSLAAALTIRAVVLFWTFLLGPIFSLWLLKKALPMAGGPDPNETEAWPK